MTVLPGDVVLAKSTGVAFIPPHLVQKVVIAGEFTALYDEYIKFAMNTNKYEYVNERFVVDDDVLEKDFKAWLNKHPNLPMPKKELDNYLKEREQKRRDS